MSQFKSEREFLDAYDSTSYEQPSVTVDTLVFTVMDEQTSNYRKLANKKLCVLMVNRKNYPDKDKWAIPGGFVEMNEDLDAAALRELKEETNVDDIYIEQLYTYGDVGRDPRTRVISCTYLSLANSSKLNIKAGDDAKQAMWFDVTCNLIESKKITDEQGYRMIKVYQIRLKNDTYELHSKIKVNITTYGKQVRMTREVIESKDIAFDHALMILYGLERLRNKIEYTDIAFHLMEETFTLTELQQVYEVILGKELLKANFRRKIAGMVVETDQYTKDAGHRPSQLHRFNSNWDD